MNVYLLILITCLCTLGGQLILKRAVDSLKPLMQAGALEFILGAAFSPLVMTALALQVLGYVSWLFVLSKEQLSIAFAISGSLLYLLTAAASWYFYDERLTLVQWAGLGLISAGVVMVTYRPG